jgi:hypothetical protein
MTAMNELFSTHFLNGVYNSLIEPGSFLLDRYFPMIQQAEAEEIHFDITDKCRRLAPFVSPKVAGRIVEEKGYRTYTFKPAYIKIKTRIDPSAKITRAAGEQIGGTVITPAMSDAQIEEIQKKNALKRVMFRVNTALEDHQDRITRRLEWMAAKALFDGAVTIEGELYQTSHVNFGRNPAHRITLPEWRNWANPGISWLNDLCDWSLQILQETGATARDVIVTPDVWAVLKDHPVTESFFSRVQTGNPTTLQTGGPVGEGGTFMGEIDGFRIFLYTGWSQDEAGIETPLLPPGTCLLLSDSIQGVRAFGAIMDMAAPRNSATALQPVPIPTFTKSWADSDPSLRWVMTQCAPLVFPARVNAMVAATVL